MNDEITLYKLFSIGFLYPQEGHMAALRETSLFAESLNDVTLEALQREHSLIFSLSVAGGVPPYETEYGIKDVFMKTQNMADVSGFYRAFGMEVSKQSHERIDFIGAELELMHWLALKESHALETNRKKEARICHDAAAKFLKDHLGRWAPFLGEQIAKTSRLPFYCQLGQELATFIRAECETFGVTPDEVKQWEPSLPVAELTCDASECQTDQGVK